MASRREFLVVEADVNWVLIVEIRDDALLPTASTSLHSFQMSFHTTVFQCCRLSTVSTEPTSQTTGQPVFNICSQERFALAAKPTRKEIFIFSSSLILLHQELCNRKVSLDHLPFVIVHQLYDWANAEGAACAGIVVIQSFGPKVLTNSGVGASLKQLRVWKHSLLVVPKMKAVVQRRAGL